VQQPQGSAGRPQHDTHEVMPEPQTWEPVVALRRTHLACGVDVQHARQQEAAGLAGASLGDGHQVTPSHGDGPRLRLDRRRVCEPRALDLQEDSWMMSPLQLHPKMLSTRHSHHYRLIQGLISAQVQQNDVAGVQLA
jgi:hypothetical protein